jgi:hypothetical protein
MKSKRWKRRNRVKNRQLYRGYLYLSFWGYSVPTYYLRWIAGWGIAVKKQGCLYIELIWDFRTPLVRL